MNYRLIKLMLLLIALTVFFIHPVYAEPDYPGGAGWNIGFDKQRALDHVYVLASDSLRGRYSGFQGAELLDAYITGHFSRIGLEQPFGDDGYLHRFSYGAGEYAMPSSLLFHYEDGTVDTAYMWQDFNIYKYSGFGDVKGRLLFVGYGISAPDKGWDDYAELDAEGAVVLAMRGAPDIPNVRWGKERGSGYKSTLALERGAVGFIMTDGSVPKYATIGQKYYRDEMPAVWMSSDLADTLLKSTGKTKSEWVEEIGENGKPVSQALNIDVSLQVGGEYFPERETHNFVGILPGTDPELKREAVLIGAHADHHGVDAAGNVYPGADDNASGAAVMMELAELFAKSPLQNKRTLIFAGFAAEEEGLVGSGKLVDDLPIGDYKIVSMINMDMVGQGDGSIGVAGLGEFPILGDLMFSQWSDTALNDLKFWGLHGSSDQASFMEAGIPSYIVGARGKHPNYHTPNDTAGAIKTDILKSVGEMTYHCVTVLANHPEPLRVHVNKGQRLLRKYGGIEFITLEPVYKPDFLPVKGVSYSDPLTFVTLTNEDDKKRLLDDILSQLESARSSAEERSISFMADSVNEGYDGNSFSGMTVIIGGSRLLFSGKSLKSLSRLGVSFMDVTGMAKSRKKKTRKKLDQVLDNCLEAGVQPYVESVSPETVTKLSEQWEGGLLHKLNYSKLGGKSLIEFFNDNCFLLLDAKEANFSDYGYIIAEVNKVLSTKYGDNIGIIVGPPLLNSLLAQDVEEDVIIGLIGENLKIWMRDIR